MYKYLRKLSIIVLDIFDIFSANTDCFFKNLKRLNNFREKPKYYTHSLIP